MTVFLEPLEAGLLADLVQVTTVWPELGFFWLLERFLLCALSHITL